MTATSDWDRRYDRPDYLFGTAPAAFLERHGSWLRAGARALCVADGEGRNSVYLARLGLSVTAFDASRVALAKARRLAEAEGVAVDFRESGVEDWDWSMPFDLVVAIFIQFAAPPLKERVLAGLAQALSPGGVLMLHGYTPRQLVYGTGGPGREENLYTPEALRAAFASLEIVHLEEYDAEVDEGAGHRGTSALIDLIARKPASDAP